MSTKNLLRMIATATLLLLCAACSGARKPVAAGGPVQRPSENTGPREVAADPVEAERDARMATALERAAQGGWNDLRLVCECRTEDSWAAAEVFSDGTAVWNNATQFQLDRSALVEVLRDIQRFGFAAMPASFGGRKRPEDFAMRVTCRLALEIDGASKEVVQLEKGDQSAELREIAESVFRACRGPAASGISAADLEDALNKVAGGTLAGATLELTLNRKPDDDALRAGEEGYLLRIETGTAVVRPYLPGGIGREKSLRLQPAEIQGLALLLAENGAPELPVNLYADSYTDLSLRVLKWKKSVQARQFANMTPATHGPRQLQFDAIYDQLRQVAEEVLRRGAERAGAPE